MHTGEPHPPAQGTSLSPLAPAIPTTFRTQGFTAQLFAEATKTLSIVLPAYNEDGRIQSTLLETMRYLERRRDREGPAFTYEVIVADDGSKDATTRCVCVVDQHRVHRPTHIQRRVALDFAKQHSADAVRVVRLPRNKGKVVVLRLRRPMSS